MRIQSNLVPSLREQALLRAMIAQRQRQASPTAVVLDADQLAELARCRASFRHFLRYWQFINRETGEVRTFENLWPGQEDAVAHMERERWLFMLKAGKLGFTELECAFDGWQARFGQANCHVGLFSRDRSAAKALLRYVKFGLRRLPAWMKLPILAGPGGDTTESLILQAGPDDLRMVQAWATKGQVAIDQTLTHAHLDELSNIDDPETLWGSVSTIIAPGGSCHIVTRGRGAQVYTADLWRQCRNNGGDGQIFGFFADAFARPDRSRAWYEDQAGRMPHQALLYYAPMTPEDALAGDDANVYIPVGVWDRCYDPALPPLLPGDRTPVVMAVDASVSGDMFAIALVSRNPAAPEDPAVRACYAYDPREEADGRIDFQKVERFMRFMCHGGCPAGHPQALPDPDCPSCQAGDFSVRGLNIVQIAYDPYQQEDMMQRLERDGVAWCDAFDQGTDRLLADATLYARALRGQMVHCGSPLAREHIGNAKAQIPKGLSEDSKMRIVKAGAGKIDLAVAMSMGVYRILELNVV